MTEASKKKRQGKQVQRLHKQPYETRQWRRRRADAYDKLHDDHHDFPPHDDREDEERARYEAAGVHEDAAPGTEPC